MKKLFLFAICSLFLISCTDNERARNYGGTSSITLKPNQRVINASFKEHDLWILTKIDTTKPTTYNLVEKSSFGILEGTVIINEQ